MNALGFHYFPDTLHYRQADLDAWLPELIALDAKWLVLQAEAGQAVPETFLRGVMDAGITPILQVQTQLKHAPNPYEQRPLLEAYARWGVQYVQYFDTPNQHSAWPASDWAQQNLVERFLDAWLPFASLTASTGLHPVLPPLYPGGSYWDTAFLESALGSILRRKMQAVADSLVISAYGWTDGRPLDWGSGGPQAWPGSRPYLTAEGSQDQRGFRVFDWYLHIAEKVLKRTPGFFLYQAGLPASPADMLSAGVEPEIVHPDLLAIARLACGEEVILPGSEKPLDPLPEDVSACCMWLLAASPESAYHAQAWFQSATESKILAESWKQHRPKPTARAKFFTPDCPVFDHYLLLPTFAWGVADWHLDVIRPYIKKYRPTIGFSLQEAALAKRVTVIGNDAAFPAEEIQDLRNRGVVVEQIDESGIELATSAEER